MTGAITKSQQTITGKSRSDSPTFSVFMGQDNIKKLVSNVIGKNAQAFTTAIVSAVSNNPDLQKCDQISVLSAAMQGEALKLSHSQQLGQYYMVPFNDNKNGRVVAQFILGAKGYKQLAIRSGQYRDIDVLEIKEGEYKGRDKFTGKQVFEFIEDDDVREALPTIGYMAYFELINGFRKVAYWTYDKMLNHADKYSQAFSKDKLPNYIAGKVPEKELWKYSSYWYKDFNGMAQKTMIRHLLSQWGIMSIEMQRAYEIDGAVLKENGDYDYIDSDTGEVLNAPQAQTHAETAIPEVEITADEKEDLRDIFGDIVEE